jgi:uncharacterized membrane protein
VHLKLCCLILGQTKSIKQIEEELLILFMALALAIVSFLVLANSRYLIGEAASKGELHPSLGCSVFIGISFTHAFRYVPRMVEFYQNQADG